MLSIVTGASRGIGLEYARVLARDYGSDLILVARSEDSLNQAARDITAQYGVKADVVAMDLSERDAAERLHGWTVSRGMEPDVLVNNAGTFFFNEFVGTSMERIEGLLSLHVITLTKLCRLYGQDFCARGSGYILNMSSLSTWMVCPGIQTYNASKAYIYNFTKSLRFELRPKGVQVLTVTPGMVDTTLYGLNADLRKLAVRLGINTPPERLAKKALRRLFKGRKTCMPGAVNHIAKPFLKHLPDWVIRFTMKRIAKYQK